MKSDAGFWADVEQGKQVKAAAVIRPPLEEQEKEAAEI